MVKISLDGVEREVDDGTTILEAAQEIGIDIPTLCHNERLSSPGACRMCVVEVEGSRNLLPSCSTHVKEGMSITTNSKRVIDSRRMTLQLLIAEHPSCLECSRNGDCRLQRHAETLVIDENIFNKTKDIPKEYSISLERDNQLCILCGQCVRVCDEVQSVHAIDFVNRGHKSYVGTAFDISIDDAPCVSCGQCVLHCPTGALNEKLDIQPVLDALDQKRKNPDKHLVAQIAPSVRVSAGEPFGLEPGELVTGKVTKALKMMGFDAVFDIDFSADLTIMEEANELVERISSGGKLPMFTSCCPGWVKFMENYYPDMLGNLSTCKSPQGMHGAIAKTYYAEKIGKSAEDIIMVDVMPCTAKKFEINRPQLNKNGYKDIDHVLTTREFAKLCNINSIDLASLEDADFDDPMGVASGAGDIFGTTGGVMEAALRTAYETITSSKLEKLEFDEISGYEGVKLGKVELDGKELSFGVAHGLNNARSVLEDIRSGKLNVDFFEVMACPGGCIGGGGQPRPTSVDVIKKRIAGLRSLDSSKTLRRSHENPSIRKLYDDYLGQPGSELSHHLLHTRFYRRNRWKTSSEQRR
ncbi:MAG: NADH-dependent [FeFe] hydrogenase, group A6 [Candidatus Woesearchaeota archaeon]